MHNTCMYVQFVFFVVAFKEYTMRESQFLLNCTSFSASQLKALNITRGASGWISLVITICILLKLLYKKAYKSALQRMFLYLTGTTILLEAFIAMQIERQFQYPGQEQFCSALGFLSQLSAGISYMFTLEITVFLLYIVYQKLHRDPFPIVSKTKMLRILSEVLFVFGAIIIPLSYDWIPFLNGNYGLATTFCWVKGIDTENCTDIGTNYQLGFYVIAEMIGTVSILAMLTLSIVYCRIAYTYKTVRSQQRKLVGHTLILMCFLSTHVITLTISIVTRYIPGTKDNYILWMINATGIPISLLIVPIGFLVYIHTINGGRVTCWYRKQGSVDERTRLRTNPSSHPVKYPSHTTWTPPYTGAFDTTNDSAA